MGKKKGNFFMGLLALSLVLGLLSGPAWAASKLTTGGGSASVDLQFQINIPTILYLQVGSTGATVDTFACTLSDIPGTGAVTMSTGSGNTVTVRAAGLVPAGHNMVLTANSSTPMGGAGGIPFDQITCAATGSFTGYTFNNGAAQVLNTLGGSGDYNGTYAFTYANANYYPTGTYNGTVTYTLAAP